MVHFSVSELCQQFTPLVERLGFDENFLDVTELINQRKAAGSQVIGHEYGGRQGIYMNCFYLNGMTRSHLLKELIFFFVKDSDLTLVVTHSI